MAWGNQSASSSNCQGCNLCLKKMTFQYCFDGSIKKVNNLSVSSPRTWGCFPILSKLATPKIVFPTHVGVFPRCSSFWRAVVRLPHARGGVSMKDLFLFVGSLSSPRTWGCFHIRPLLAVQAAVFPTHVGVFPTRDTLNSSFCRLPHARGGVSAAVFRPCACLASSPRTWGCFLRKPKNRTVFRVFPTHVGVFPALKPSLRAKASLPHARGGVSRSSGTTSYCASSSPRTWGCFRRCKVFRLNAVVFPTHVGVFLVLAGGVYAHGGLPHARGGVSTNRTRHRRTYPSSPRTWGCF